MPTFSAGLLSGGDSPEPVEVVMPEGFPLAKCYRFDADFKDGEESDEVNVHLLAALGTFDAPFVPVSIHGRYDGYSWASCPASARSKCRLARSSTARALGRHIDLRGLDHDYRTCQRWTSILVQGVHGQSAAAT